MSANSGVNADNGIRLYPNPVGEGNTIFLDFWGFEESEFSIQVSDLGGKILQVDSFKYTNSNSVYTLHIASKGVFNVTISKGDYTQVKRVVVQ